MRNNFTFIIFDCRNIYASWRHLTNTKFKFLSHFGQKRLWRMNAEWSILKGFRFFGVRNSKNKQDKVLRIYIFTLSPLSPPLLGKMRSPLPHLYRCYHLAGVVWSTSLATAASWLTVPWKFSSLLFLTHFVPLKLVSCAGSAFLSSNFTGVYMSLCFPCFFPPLCTNTNNFLILNSLCWLSYTNN